MFFWSKYPFVRLVLFFIIGIFLGIYLPQAGLLVNVMFSFCLVIFLILLIKSKRWLLKINFIYGLSISLLFVGFGFNFLTYANLSNRSNHLSHYNNVSFYTGKVNSAPVSRGNYLRTVIKIDKIKDSVWHPATGKVLVYLKSPLNPLPQYGDVLIIKGQPGITRPAMNPKEFNYQRYLSFNNIYHQQFIDEHDWLLVRPAKGFDVIKQSISARNYLEGKLAMYMKDSVELSIAKALILGNKEALDKPTREVYAMAGAMHVLAVSGLHVGIIYLVLLYLLGQSSGRIRNPKLVAYVVIPILWMYAFVTGLSPSVLRAVTMFSFLALAQAVNRKSNTFNTLAISAFILLLINPYMIMSVGFQLSYIAVIGIIFLYPLFEKLLNPSNRIIRVVWQITALSLAAQLATSPLSALYFHRFPTYFLISNLLVIPAATLIVWGGLALLILGSLSSTVGMLLGKAITAIIGLVNDALQGLAHFPASDIHNLAPTILDTWLIYAFLVLVFLFIIQKNWLYYKLALVVVLTLVTSFIYTDYQARNFKQIVFYSVNNSWAVDLIVGKQYTSLADSGLVANKEKVDYLIHPYRRFYGLTQGKQLLNKKKFPGLGDVLVWEGKKILLARACLKEDEIPPYFDYVLYKVNKADKKCYQEPILLSKFVENHQQHYVKYELRKNGAQIINI